MNLLIFLYLIAVIPKLLFDRVWKGKRHPAFLQRLGMNIPTPSRGEVIWIHAVSVGEVKAAQPLFQELKKKEKGAFFLITTTTATGQAEAKRSLREADAFAYLPIDLTWVVRRWIKKLKPKTFILVESDFWYNLLKELKKSGAKNVLVSGKMSARSAKRFLRLSWFAKKLFSHFDQICTQNETHYQRFLPLVPNPDRLHVTGNLKLDIQPQPVETSLQLPQPAITISCTHAPEEEWLLDALQEGNWFIVLAPRHPERFEEVAELLTRKKIPFSRWSKREIHGKDLENNKLTHLASVKAPAIELSERGLVSKQYNPLSDNLNPGALTQPNGSIYCFPDPKVLLLDAMGQLPIFYAHSRLAIVAGSFVGHIGGHNVLEPCLYGTPVFFGPHTFGQTEFASLALEFGAAMKVDLENLRENVEKFLSSPQIEETMRAAALKLIQSSRGVTTCTLQSIES